jgi:hypothetical protein
MVLLAGIYYPEGYKNSCRPSSLAALGTGVGCALTSARLCEIVDSVEGAFATHIGKEKSWKTAGNVLDPARRHADAIDADCSKPERALDSDWL